MNTLFIFDLFTHVMVFCFIGALPASIAIKAITNHIIKSNIKKLQCRTNTIFKSEHKNNISIYNNLRNHKAKNWLTSKKLDLPIKELYADKHFYNQALHEEILRHAKVENLFIFGSIFYSIVVSFGCLLIDEAGIPSKHLGINYESGIFLSKLTPVFFIIYYLNPSPNPLKFFMSAISPLLLSCAYFYIIGIRDFLPLIIIYLLHNSFPCLVLAFNQPGLKRITGILSYLMAFAFLFGVELGGIICWVFIVVCAPDNFSHYATSELISLLDKETFSIEFMGDAIDNIYSEINDYVYYNSFANSRFKLLIISSIALMLATPWLCKKYCLLIIKHAANLYKKNFLRDESITNFTIVFIFFMQDFIFTLPTYENSNYIYFKAEKEGFMMALSEYSTWNAMLVYIFALAAFFLIVQIPVRKKMGRGNTPRHLLYLRVFNHKDAEDILQGLSRYWKNKGPITIVTSSDIILTTIQPSEFLSFLSGNLRSCFIKNSHDITKIKKTNINFTSHNGEYKVTGVFCRDNTWKDVIKKYLENTQAVFMDLRGFSSQNDGCVFEIYQLRNVLLKNLKIKVSILVDAKTELTYILNVIQNSKRSANTNIKTCEKRKPCITFIQASHDHKKNIYCILNTLI